MEALIPVINKLQDLFSVAKGANLEAVHLPQIVVVGNQSAGKSSVIESIVGRDFLPRGSGIVTRCPLILQLIRRKETTRDSGSWSSTIFGSNSGEYAEFLHRKNQMFVDFAKVRKEIVDETERRTGGRCRISNEPITLKIYSPNTVNLTLVDLPGMTKMPVQGQPDDIEVQIRTLIESFIQQPNSIILAVIAANADLATSDALKLAKIHDPNGKRTLAVLTKLDLMDRGTDATEILLGKVIPVKLGIIGVMNRCQQDIVNNKSIQVALKEEADYLQEHYPTLASQNGSDYLVKKMNAILLNHIRDCLPGLRTRVETLIEQNRKLLDSYGDAMEDQSHTLLDIIRKFASVYESAIQGSASDIETTELSGGARICQIFQEKFYKDLDDIDSLGGQTDEEIMCAIKNASGLAPALNLQQPVFEKLVKKQLKKLESPSLRCVELVRQELQNILENCRTELEPEISRFPQLLEEMVAVITELLSKRLPATNEMVRNLIECELSYINVKHEAFRNPFGDLVNSAELAPGQAASFLSRTSSAIRGNLSQVLNLPYMDLASLRLDDPKSREKVECEIVRTMIVSYFSIVKSQVRDLVPKIIVCFLVNKVRDRSLSELIGELYREDLFDSLLSESKEIAAKRAETTDMLDALEKALQIISEINEHRT